MSEAGYTIRSARWPEDEPALRAVRERVFVEEQAVPLDLEWDGLDAGARHLLALADGQPIGTVRMLSDGHIGRMAVLATWRRRGVGSALLGRLLDDARAARLHGVWLNAQTHAVSFYERFGFNADGREFLDAGIPHRRMVLKFAPDEPTRPETPSTP